jgi:prophage antirepressor-like protein
MNEIQTFNNAEFGSIRTAEENGQIWFCGKDIAVALNYTNPKKAITDHCREDGVTIRSLIDSMGRIQQAKFINEPNLYRLITHSKLPSAEKFEQWVFEEVLPAIRKTGHYEVPGYAPKATSVGEVVNLIKVTRQTMKEQGATPTEIATAVKEICEQFGVNLPQCFIKPKETTMTDVMQMIDFIYSQPKGRGHKTPTYDDFIIYQASLKRLGG